MAIYNTVTMGSSPQNTTDNPKIHNQQLYQILSKKSHLNTTHSDEDFFQKFIEVSILGCEHSTKSVNFTARVSATSESTSLLTAIHQTLGRGLCTSGLGSYLLNKRQLTQRHQHNAFYQ